MEDRTRNQSRTFRGISGHLNARGLALGLLLALAMTAAGCRLGEASGASEGGTAEAVIGELVITVTDGGTLRAAESIDIISRVESNSTVLWLIEEGTHVSAGDELVRLDPTELLDRQIREESELRNQEASAQASASDLAITRNRATSDVNKAELAVRFAEMDLKKYIEGDLPQQRRRAEASIIIAEEELQRALDRLNGTKRLEGEGIVSRQELEADTFAVKKAEINLAEAKQSLVLLEEFESTKQLARLESDFEEAKRELDRVRQKTESEVAQSTASNAARQANLSIQRQKYQRVLDQIEQTTIVAPQAGIIVYWTPPGRWGNQRPVEVGGQVRFRQTLMILPDISKMVVDAKIHESQVDRVREGMPATIRVEAFPERLYRGSVHRISVMADSANWMTPDVKEYKTIIAIDPGQNMEGLRPNMNARVEILAGQLRDKLIVPVTGVHTLRGRTAALVLNGSRVEVREVKVGPTNDSMIVIEDGLSVGDVVMLHRPQVMPEIPWADEQEPEHDSSTMLVVPVLDNGNTVAPRRNAAGDGNAGEAGGERPAGSRRRGDGPGGEGRVRTEGAEGRPRPERVRPEAAATGGGATDGAGASAQPGGRAE